MLTETQITERRKNVLTEAKAESREYAKRWAILKEHGENADDYEYMTIEEIDRAIKFLDIFQ